MAPRQPSRVSGARSRQAQGGVYINWDLAAIQKLAKEASAAEPNALNAIREAHDSLAMLLQRGIAAELQASIKQRGRDQRETQLLLGAIMDERTRVVNVTGFTVGNLDQFAIVRDYYENLDVGTDVFEGRRIYGMFQSSGGHLVDARSLEGGREEQVDPRFIQFRSARSASRKSRKRGRHIRSLPFITIQHPIEGYEYFEKGAKRFRKGGTAIILAAYKEAFKQNGMDFMERWTNRWPSSSSPSASEVAMQRAGYGG